MLSNLSRMPSFTLLLTTSKQAFVLRGVALTFTLALLWGCQASPREVPLRVVDGEIDLTDWEFSKHGAVSLDGEWLMAWSELLGPEAFPASGPLPDGLLIQKLPSGFAAYPQNQGPEPGMGYATYFARLQLPPGRTYGFRLESVSTAYRFWVNGRLVSSQGQVGVDRLQSVPHSATQIGAFFADQARVDLVLQVSNFHHRAGGMRGHITLGLDQQVASMQFFQSGVQAFLTGCLLIMGVYYCIWFAARRRDLSALYFGLFCLLAALRMSVTNDKIINIYLAIDYEWLMRLEYLSFYFLLPIFLMLFRSLFPDEFPQRVVRAAQWAAIAYGVVVMATPVAVFSHTVRSFQIITAITCVFAVIALFLALRHRREGARWFLLSFGVIFAAFINDAANSMKLVDQGSWTPLAQILFVFIQANILSQRFSKAYARVEALSRDVAAANTDLQLTNEAVQRFVPYEFLSLLKRSSIREVTRGDSTSMPMDVLFCDLRNFTAIIESLPSQEAFAFINDWLAHMEPHIRKNDGFVNQFLGDCIMALFAGGADQSIKAGVDMLRALDEFNASQAHLPETVIRVGIGINSGPIMLGTIGAANRLASGVVGDAVNVAARVEGITKMYGTPFLISEATLQRVVRPDAFHLRELDTVVAKGKSQPMRIFEVLDALPAAQRAERVATASRYAQGLAAYREGDFRAAEGHFGSCVEQSATDAPAQLLRARCHALVTEPPGNWNGVSVLLEK